MQKGKIDIPIVKRAVPQSWNTSNGTFQTKKVGDIELSFLDYSTSKRVQVTPDNNYRRDPLAHEEHC